MEGKSLAAYFVTIHPKGDNFNSELKQQVAGPKTQQTGKDAGTSLGKGMLAGLGAVFAAGVVVDFFKGAFAEAQEANKVFALTNAVLKSTGQAANVSAREVTDLAGSLSDLSGVDDEVIEAGENVLLTFTKVRNEAGKGNDIFNQGTAAALNLSAALGTDLQAATILVGKALNDPIAGLTALKKAGVQLTEQQKEQIKAFVEAGDVMSAQKIILGELTTQFGGAAAAAATPADKARVAWGNFQEEVGNRLLPTLNEVLTFATAHQDWLLPLLGSLTSLALIIGTVIAAQKAWSIAQTVLGIGLDSTTGKIRKSTVAIAAMVVAAQAISAFSAHATDVDGLTDSLTQLGDANVRGGELTRLFGSDLAGFRQDAALAGDGVNGVARAVEGAIPGLRQLADALPGRSFGDAQERIQSVDDTLATMARNGHVGEARAALYQLSQAAHLTADEAEALFPKYNNAMREIQRGTTAVTIAQEAASDAGQHLIDTWNELTQTELAADDALLKAHTAIDGIKDAFEEGSKSIEGNSRAAVENRVAIEREAQAAQEAAAEIIKNGGSHDDAAALIADFKEQAIKATGATGAEAEAIRVLADRLFSIPANVTSTVRVDTYHVDHFSNDDQRSAQGKMADGGILKFFAGGGIENHVAQIVRAGSWRVWGEDETGGEGYIPLALSKRARSTEILATIAQMFGYNLVSNDAEPGGTTVGGSAANLDTGGGGSVAMLLAEQRRTNDLLAQLLPAVAPALAAALTGGAQSAYQLARTRG